MNEHLFDPIKPVIGPVIYKKGRWCKYHGTSEPHCVDGELGEVILFNKRNTHDHKRCKGTCKHKETDWLPKKNKCKRNMLLSDFKIKDRYKIKTYPLIGKGATCPICLETTKNTIIQDLPCKHEIHKSCFAKFIEPRYEMVEKHTHNYSYISENRVHVSFAMFSYVEVRTNPHKEISCPICRTKIFDKKCPKKIKK